MKPGDHPDFFRLPAPAGRSRESSIVLDEEGQFWHDGERIEHKKMRDAFLSWLSRHPDDGRPILQNGYDWCYLELRGAPFRVTALRPREGGSALLLSNGEEAPITLAGMRLDQNGRLHAPVRAGDFEARFTPGAQAALTDWLRQTPSGEFLLDLPEGPIPIAQPEDSESSG